jgi:hypothetical protein
MNIDAMRLVLNLEKDQNFISHLKRLSLNHES